MLPLKNEDFKILIIEDNPKNIQVLGLLLKREGFSTFISTSGEAGIKSAKKHLPDLILLDINLPGIDGIEVCKTIKDSSETLHIPIIFLTSNDDQSKKIEGFSAGGSDYVSKPFDQVELLARINTHLGLKVFREQLVKDAEVKVKLKAHGVISHEVYNPLNSILNNLDLIEMGIKKEIIDKDKLLSYLKSAQNASDEIVSKVNKLKEYKDVFSDDLDGVDLLFLDD